MGVTSSSLKKYSNSSDSTAKIPQKKDFIKNMNSKYGKVNSKNIWKGIKFVKKGDDEEEDD